MKKLLIDQTLEFIKDIFENDYSGHDYFHTYRVYKMATRIAIEENAVNFLRVHNVEEKQILEICEIISEVSFAGGDSVIPKTIEGRCVQDADRLDAIGAIGIARAFAYGGNHNRMMYHPDIEPKLNMSKSEYDNHISTTVNHFYEKLFLLKDLMNTKTAKEIAKNREVYMRKYISEFMDEWDGIK